MHGLGVRLELLPPSSRQLRVVFQLRIWFADWPDMPAPF